VYLLPPPRPWPPSRRASRCPRDAHTWSLGPLGKRRRNRPSPWTAGRCERAASYTRARQHPGWPRQRDHHRRIRPRPSADRADPAGPAPDSGERHVFVAVDAVGYSRAPVSEHSTIQRDPRAIL